MTQFISVILGVLIACLIYFGFILTIAAICGFSDKKYKSMEKKND